MKNITKLLIGTTAVVAVVGGVIIDLKKCETKENEAIEKNYFAEQIAENNGEIFKVLDIDNTKDELFACITIKNVSNKDIKRANIKVGFYTYELYDIGAGETYCIFANDKGDETNIEVISIEYVVPNYNEDEVSVKTSYDESKITRRNI